MSHRKIKFPLGPIRTCVVCNVKQPKLELLRLGIVDGQLCSQQKGCGRGVYVCPDHTDTQINKKRKRISHLLCCNGDYDISLSSGSGV